ncbi:MAG: Pr6Pr family membrane protein [Clostridia bacterium]
MRKLSIINKFLIVICEIVGLTTHFLGKSDIVPSFFYFTVLSNFGALVVFCFVLVKTINGGFSQKLQFAKMLVTQGILVTFVIYGFVLTPAMSLIDISTELTFSSFILHYLAPSLIFVDYCLYDNKGLIKWWHSFSYLSIFLLYPLYCYGYAFLGGTFNVDGVKTRYPYFFLDFDLLGIGQVLKYVSLLMVSFLVVSLLFFALDRIMSRYKTKSHRQIEK